MTQRASASSLPTAAVKIFAHFSEIRTEGFKTLQENQKVTFEVKTGPKGKQAANIKPV